MKGRLVRNIGTISLSLLIIASTLVIISSSSPAVAGADTATSTATSSSGSDEVAAASGSNRFVVWYDNTPGNFDILFKRSTDNGATWQAIKNLSNNPGHSFDPDIAVSGSNVYVVWLQEKDAWNRDIFFRRSTDNGATWEPSVKITWALGDPYTPSIQVVSSGNNVYVIWDKQDGEIYFRRSTDNGATWKPIFNLSTNPGDSFYPQIGVSGSNVYVVWHQENADRSKSDAFFRRSADNGATWMSKVNLSNVGRAGFPQIAVSGSNIHVVWGQGVPGDIEVFIRSSANSGATWNPAKNLSNSPTTISINPRIAISGSNIYVVYQEHQYTETCQNFDLVFRASRDNGTKWEPAVTLKAWIDTCAIDNVPRIIALGSNVYVVWIEGGPGSGDLRFRGSTDNGKTWGPVSNDLNNKMNAPRSVQIAASGSSVYLVWSHHVAGQVYFLRSINNGETWESVKNLSANKGKSWGPQIAV